LIVDHKCQAVAASGDRNIEFVARFLGLVCLERAEIAPDELDVFLRWDDQNPVKAKSFRRTESVAGMVFGENTCAGRLGPSEYLKQKPGEILKYGGSHDDEDAVMGFCVLRNSIDSRDGLLILAGMNGV